VAVSLMTALDTSGDRAAALQHAQIHETLLREELGIAPDPAVATLAERLRSPSAPPQHKAPTVPDLDSTARVGEFESRGGGSRSKDRHRLRECSNTPGRVGQCC
jgi:DNA-binding SARP family transcriptional activator